MHSPGISRQLRVLALTFFFIVSIGGALANQEDLRDPFITYTLDNGAKYTGEWNYNREPHGKGQYIDKVGNEYNGTLENGQLHGSGVMYYVNGDVYKGRWRYGKKFGQGSMTYKNGNIYEGYWNEDQRNGKGSLTYRSGSRYEGRWLDDKRHGKGMFVSKSGQRYIGDYAHNKPHGKGVEVSSNGDSYTGTFSKGQKHGVGECVPRNGSVDVCLFDRGKRITNKRLLERARAYYEKNAPTHEFEQGIAFLFEDQYTKQRRWLEHEAVYWETTEAMLATQLKLRTLDTSMNITIVIDDYQGIGSYELTEGSFTMRISGKEPIYLSEGERLILEITTDYKGEIEGKFSATRLQSGEGETLRFYAIRNGRFQAFKKPAKEKKLKDNREAIRAQYR